MKNITIHSLNELQQFAADFAKTVRVGSVITLEGELGAGKTAFTKQLAHSLGVQGSVTSPTFSIMNTYALVKDSLFVHIDLYRVQKPEEIESIGLSELIDEEKHIIIIEWPEIAHHMLPSNTIHLTFSIVDESTRNIVLQG